MRDTKEFQNNRSMTPGNDSVQQKSNANQSYFKEKQKGHAPSSTRAPTQTNRGEYGNNNK